MRTLTKIGAGLALTAFALTGCSAGSGDEKPASISAETETETETVEEEAPAPEKCADEGTVYGDVIADKIVEVPGKGFFCSVRINPEADILTMVHSEPAGLFSLGGSVAELDATYAGVVGMITSVLNADALPNEESMTDAWWAEEAPKHLGADYIKSSLYPDADPAYGELSYLVSPYSTLPAVYDAKAKFESVKFTDIENAMVLYRDISPNHYVRATVKAEVVVRIESEDAMRDFSEAFHERYEPNETVEYEYDVDEDTGEVTAKQRVTLTLSYMVGTNNDSSQALFGTWYAGFGEED